MAWNKQQNKKSSSLNQDHSRHTNALIVKYEALIEDYGLNPSFLRAFELRLKSANAGGRDSEAFLEEELGEYRNIEQMVQHKQEVIQTQEEIFARTRDGKTTADKVLDEYKQRILKYPEFNIHPEADQEISKLYGAMDYFDSHYWDEIESFLRRAFPRPGQIDRMSIEQRYWRFVSSTKESVPKVLDRYDRALSSDTTGKAEKHGELREAIKLLAFFLHDLVEVLERAMTITTPDDQIHEAMDYINGTIKDFRLQSLRRTN